MDDCCNDKRHALSAIASRNAQRRVLMSTLR